MQKATKMAGDCFGYGRKVVGMAGELEEVANRLRMRFGGRTGIFVVA